MVVKAVENKRKTWQVHLPKVNAPHYKAIYIGKLNMYPLLNSDYKTKLI
jgi:hypothetical protein